MIRFSLSIFSATLLALAAGCGAEIGDDAEGMLLQELTASGVTGTLRLDNDWGGGYCASVTLRNQSSSAVTNWTVVMNSGGSTVNNLWSGKFTQSGSTVTVTPESYNASIPTASETSFGFCANGSGRPTITSMTIVGGGSGGGSGGTSGSGGSTSTGGTSSGGTSSSGGSSSGGSGGGTSGQLVCGAANENGSANLTCPSGTTISSVRFASYGTPTGSCGSYAAGSCNASTSRVVVEAACLGKTSCSVPANNSTFGDPCRGTAKRLAVEAICSSGSGGSGGSSGSGGSTGSGGSGTGGSSGGGSNGTIDADGCPINLEGFATINAMGQNGTYGGRDGQTVTVSNQADLERYAIASAPYTIRVQGPIRISPKGKEIRVASDKTIVGVGTSGEIREGGFFLGSGVHNVILRNLTIQDAYVEGDWDGKENDFDGIQMDTAHHVWIDHCHLRRMGDGLIDSRKDTTFLTVSWNILSDHNKAFGIGWTDNVTTQMTIHHNWLRDLGTRNPSTDNVLRAHLYNNWLLRTNSYGNYARGGTHMVLENSVFDRVANPHYYDTGSLVARGNVYRNTSGQRESSGSSYSAFDPRNFYSYTLHSAQEVEALLTKCAGPRPTLGL